MKKRIILLTALTFSLIFIFLLCSCGKGNEKTKVIYIDRDERYGYCEHRWESQGQTFPTCTKEGTSYMKCTLCGERGSAKIPTVECEYTESWQWYNSNSSVALILHCKHNPAHNRTVMGHVGYIYGELVQPSTCTEAGKLKYRASAVYQGKTYTAERIEPLSKAPHTYETASTPLGDYCFAGTKTVQKCTECGIEKSYTQKIKYEHTDTALKARYELSSYGYCGGYIEINGCECGETTYLSINPSCENMHEVCEVISEREENSEKHIRMTQACADCGLCIVKENGTVYGGSKPTELYSKKTVRLDENTTLSHCDVTTAHENLPTSHEASISYEHLGKSCKDGFFVNIACKDCPYEKKFYTRGHYLIDETVSVDSLGACGHEIILERCHCGYIDDIYFGGIDRIVMQIPLSEHFGEEYVKPFYSNAAAYKCTECGVSYFIGDIVEVTEVDGTEIAIIYEICSVKKNGETIYEVKSSDVGYIL